MVNLFISNENLIRPLKIVDFPEKLRKLIFETSSSIGFGGSVKVAAVSYKYSSPKREKFRTYETNQLSSSTNEAGYSSQYIRLL